MNHMSNCCKPKIGEIDLVTNAADPSLINPWGIVVDNNYIWTTANKTDLLIRYDLPGVNPYYIAFYSESGVLLSNTAQPVVKPTGIIKNPTGGYFITDGVANNTKRSIYLIASESGDLFGYNNDVGGGDKAYRIFASSSFVNHPVYKGLAVTYNHLYAVDFLNGKIDVFDDVTTSNSINLTNQISVHDVTGTNHPAPFNIVYLNNVFYVMYAYKNNTTSTDDNGTGGFIDLHKDDGTFNKNFSSDSNLKSPWGLIPTPDCFCDKYGTVMVGNFGSGAVYVYDRYGNRLGEVYLNSNPSTPIVINGLKGLYNQCDKLYFSAGPNNGTSGLVGYMHRNNYMICHGHAHGHGHGHAHGHCYDPCQDVCCDNKWQKEDHHRHHRDRSYNRRTEDAWINKFYFN